MGNVSPGVVVVFLKLNLKSCCNTPFFSGCGTELILGELRMVDGTHGDWRTDYVDYRKQRDDRNYIMVSS